MMPILVIDGKTGQVADNLSIPPIPVGGPAGGGGGVAPGLAPGVAGVAAPALALNQFLQMRQNMLLYAWPAVTNGQVAVESGAGVEVYAAKPGDGGALPTTEKAMGK